MNMHDAIKTVVEKQNLSFAEMKVVMRLIMTGEATPAQIAGFLIGLRMKGETVDEITGAASVMRDLAEKVNVSSEHLVDIVGTGGDSSGTFNVSTASIFVAAAAGASVAKHGNRSVSSKSGAADVLEAAGVSLKLNATQVASCIDKCGVGFMFAPNHHSAMKHAIGPRKEMAVRTIFNVLGPLTNPASAPNQLLGVYDAALIEPMAQVLKKLGSHHVMVVHSEDGLDEISIAAKTTVAELKEGEIQRYTVEPTQFGLKLGSLNDIKVNSAAESLAMIQNAFDNKAGAARDIIALNAGAAIYVSGIAKTISDGVQRALQMMADGSAKAKLAELVLVSNSI